MSELTQEQEQRLRWITEQPKYEVRAEQLKPLWSEIDQLRAALTAKEQQLQEAIDEVNALRLRQLEDDKYWLTAADTVLVTCRDRIAALKAENEQLRERVLIAREEWQAAQSRLADIEQGLNALTGCETDINSNLEAIGVSLAQLQEERRKSQEKSIRWAQDGTRIERLEQELATLKAQLDAAPHTRHCDIGRSHCNCWKSRLTQRQGVSK